MHWATRLTRVVVCSFYLVVYEDGDKEEMEFQELTAWLKARPRLFIKALSGGSYPMPVRDAEPRTPSSLGHTSLSFGRGRCRTPMRPSPQRPLPT